MKTGAAADDETPLNAKELAYVDYAGLELFEGWYLSTWNFYVAFCVRCG